MTPMNTPGFIANAFAAQTFIQDRVDVQQTPLYDTVTTAAGANLTTGTQFFANVGQNSGKNYAQTNLQQPYRLNSPQSFSVQSLRMRWSENVLMADVIAFQNNFALEFWLGDKWYQRGPVWHYNAGGGLSGFTTANNTSAYTNGLPSREAMISLIIPVVLENGMNFYGQLTGAASQTMTAGGSGGTGLILVLLLDGFYARGVQ